MVYSPYIKYVKIGKTVAKCSMRLRRYMINRYGTAIPCASIILYHVRDSTKAEKFIFKLLDKYRIRDANRKNTIPECFKCSVYLAKLACQKTQCEFWSKTKRKLNQEVIGWGEDMFSDALVNEEKNYRDQELLEDKHVYFLLDGVKVATTRTRIKMISDRECPPLGEGGYDGCGTEGFNTLESKTGACDCKKFGLVECAIKRRNDDEENNNKRLKLK